VCVCVCVCVQSEAFHCYKNVVRTTKNLQWLIMTPFISH